MARPRPRLLLLGLALVAALSVFAWNWVQASRGKVQMVDVPCPSRAQSDEIKPVPDDWIELCRYQAANARLLASGTKVRAVLFGDSISEWWGDADPSMFANGLVNRGITGQTSQQLVLRFRQDVLALKPQAVVLQAGLNDMMGNTGLIGPDAFIANFETLIDLAEAHGIVPVIASLPPAAAIPKRPEIAASERVLDLNHRLKALAERRGLVYADFHTPLAGADAKPRPGMSVDGVHLTEAGYALLRPILDRALAEAMATTDRGAN